MCIYLGDSCIQIFSLGVGGDREEGCIVDFMVKIFRVNTCDIYVRT